MLLIDVVNEITKRLGEGYNIISYNERAKVHFVNAISQLLKTNNYDESDIHQCIETKTFNLLDNISYISIQNDIYKILNVNNPVTNFEFVINHIPINKFNFLRNTDINEKEIYLAQEGRTIYALKNTTSQISIDIRYIFIPSFEYWENNQDLSGLSNRFLFDCIDYAKTKLLEELNQ
jgi:hypothetical protein